MIHNIDLTVPAALPVDFGSSLRQNSLWTLYKTEVGYMLSAAKMAPGSPLGCVCDYLLEKVLSQ